MIETALVQKCHRPRVHQFAAILRHRGDPHAALLRHAFKCPWLRTTRRILHQVIQKQFHSSAPGRQRGRLFQLLLRQHIQQFDQDPVHAYRKSRGHPRFVPLQHTFRKLLENLSDPRIGRPHGLLTLPQFARQVRKVLRRQNHPIRPHPILIRPPHPHIEDQPGKPPTPDMRIAQFVKLPWPRHRQLSGMKGEFPSVHLEAHRSSLQKNNFQALIAVEIQPPILASAAIPESDVRKAWQDV